MVCKFRTKHLSESHVAHCYYVVREFNCINNTAKSCLVEWHTVAAEVKCIAYYTMKKDAGQAHEEEAYYARSTQHQLSKQQQ